MNTFLAPLPPVWPGPCVERIKDGHFTNLGAASGIVAGLVAITPAAATCPSCHRSSSVSLPA